MRTGARHELGRDDRYRTGWERQWERVRKGNQRRTEEREKRQAEAKDAVNASPPTPPRYFPSELICKECDKLGHLCGAVCQLIAIRRQERIKPVEEAPVRGRRLEDIGFRPVERNKPEVYKLLCTRCNRRHDPKKVAVVGAICQFCWTPDEVENGWYLHQQWTNLPVNAYSHHKSQSE
jgi:hypothetical protein